MLQEHSHSVLPVYSTVLARVQYGSVSNCHAQGSTYCCHLLHLQLLTTYYGQIFLPLQTTSRYLEMLAAHPNLPQIKLSKSRRCNQAAPQEAHLGT